MNKLRWARQQRLAPQHGKSISLRSVKRNGAFLFYLFKIFFFFLVSFPGPTRSLLRAALRFPAPSSRPGIAARSPRGRAGPWGAGRCREGPAREGPRGARCRGHARPGLRRPLLAEGTRPGPVALGGLEPGSAPPPPSIPDKRGWSQHTPYLDSFSSVAHQHANCCMTNYALNSSWFS